MSEEQFSVGDFVAVKSGEQFEDLELDMSGWQGQVVDVDPDDGDLLVEWDSQTLRDIPETAVAHWVAEGVEWSSMYIEPEALQPAQPRQDEEDRLAVMQERYAVFGVDMADVIDDLLWSEEEDEDDFLDEEEYDWFDLDQFLEDWQIPKKEHAPIRRCLTAGLAAYILETYGYDKYGKRPTDYIGEFMHVPYIFGYGAVQIIADKRISQESKLKVIQYVFETIDVDYDGGVPYGLLTLLGFLADIDRLHPAVFLLAAVSLEYGGLGLFRHSVWMSGATKEALLSLTDWITANPDMPEQEKVWWIWKLTVHCEHDPHLGKALATHWLEKPEVSAELKRALCYGWLWDNEPPGEPPIGWRLTAAYQMGDVAEVKRLMKEADIDPAQVGLPNLEEIMPAPANEEQEFFRQLLMGPRFIMTPAYLRRLAIPALVRYGEDLETVTDTFWGERQEYYADAVHQGVADAIAEFHNRLAPEAVRRLVERGIDHGRATTRKPFYALSTQLYGDEYLARALQDNARSVRNWAAKQMKQD